MARKHKLVIVNPGHFHAALTLRERHPLIEDEVHVFAEDGPDLDNFLQLVHAFNDRPADPTRWTLYVYRGADFLEKLLVERPGQVCVVAGRNDGKMPLVHLLQTQGFFVLADKPWVIEPDQVGLLREVVAKVPLAMDIMTERHDIANRAQKALLQHAGVFGDFRTDGDLPAIALRSTHHLHKRVNGRPLQRPAWYFDPAMQGEGITDVTTHLVDLAQWLTGQGLRSGFNSHVENLSARQWTTAIPRAMFSRITGCEDFPEALQDRVVDGVLHYLCNAAIAYRLRGVPVEIETRWELEEPEAAGDLQRSILRGTRCDLVVEKGPQTGFESVLSVNPVERSSAFSAALAETLSAMQTEFPGVDAQAADAGFRIEFPRALRTTHEQHFAAVLGAFLAHVDENRWPDNLASDLETKYTLLARALELSRGRFESNTALPAHQFPANYFE